MKNFKLNLKNIFVTMFVSIIMCMLIFLTGCGDNVYVANIEKANSNGLVDNYTITYSDGSTSTFSVTNGTNGQNGNNGSKGDDVSILDVYEQYVEKYGETSYADFLKSYLNLSTTDNSKTINNCLQSALKIYTEFKTSAIYYTFYSQQIVKTTSLMCGSAIIYKMNTDYTYVLTNYHVIYNANANEDNGSKIASKIVGYLYGSEGVPTERDEKVDGYSTYNYGTYGIEFTYVGGSINYDIAVLKVATSNILAINENAKAVTVTDKYYVGQTAIAIGNPENEGISATQGIVSVDNEYISLNIDGNTRNYRSIRIDTSIYGGSSGGGLFNIYGELIGITNAGDQQNQNINYAIPIEIVCGVAENVLRNYDGINATQIKKITLGINVSGESSKYVYDNATGYGTIKEKIKVTKVVEDSMAEAMGLKTGDIITSFIVNDVEKVLDRYFQIEDSLLNIKANDTVCIKYIRDSNSYSTSTKTILNSNLNDIN